MAIPALAPSCGTLLPWLLRPAAAHLFDAARSFRVPPVCGVDLGYPRNEIVAVDGDTGTVAALLVDKEI